MLKERAEEDDDVEEGQDVLLAQWGNVLVHVEVDLVRNLGKTTWGDHYRALCDVLKASMTLDLIIEENNAKGLFSGRKQDHNVIKAACIGEMWEGREQHALRNNYFHTGSGLYNNMSVHYVMFLPPFSSPTVVVINHQIFYPPAPLLCPPSMGYKWI